MDAFCIHNARKMRINFSLVYISPCRPTFKCPIKITRQSSNSCDAGSHRCADETTARLNCPETPWRTPCRSVGRTSTSLHDVGDAATLSTAASPAPRNLPFVTLLGSKETYLSLHNRLNHLAAASAEGNKRPNVKAARQTLNLRTSQ